MWTGEVEVKAKHIKDVEGYVGRAALYQLDPPHEGCTHVVVSSAVAPFTGPETYIFPADENGDVIGLGPLGGSMRGTLIHENALNNAGYTLEN